MSTRLVRPPSGEADHGFGTRLQEAASGRRDSVTSRNNVVHQEHCRSFEAASADTGGSKGSTQVDRALAAIQAGLGPGSPLAAQDSCQWASDLLGDGTGDLLGLIEAPAQKTPPVQGHWDHQIDVLDQGRKSQAQGAADVRPQEWKTSEL